MQTRRKFIKQGCLVCLGLGAIGIGLDGCAIAQTIVHPTMTAQMMSVELSQFEHRDSIILRDKSLMFDVLIIRQGLNFIALQMRCTHNDIGLTFIGEKLVCNAHGSEFNLKGEVLKEPASQPLTNYKTEVQGNLLCVYLSV